MDEDQRQSYVKAGEIASRALSMGASLVKPSKTYLEVADAVEKMIADEGAEPAFPVNVSVNDVAAHYAPKAGDTLTFCDEDVVKIDVGVHIDGYIADTATTVDLTGSYKDMLESNKKALDEAIGLVRPGARVSEIGSVVQETMASYGYRPIENLTGHEVKRYDLHAGLSIPNIKVPYDWEIKEGMVLAIEPFATDGAGHVIESPKPEIYSLMEPKPTRMREARILLKAISQRRELPFVSRWYADRIPPLKLALVLNQLTKAEVLKSYPPLHDREGGKVSQYEHTVIVEADGCTVTTGGGEKSP